MKHRIAFALTFLLCFFTQAQAGEVFDQKPFRPYLSQGAEQAMCLAFLEAWDHLFQSDRNLDETELDLEAAFPAAVHFSLPEVNARGFYENSFSHTIDLDGDGVNQVLHMEGDDVGWRYLGIQSYLFESEEAYATARQLFIEENPSRNAQTPLKLGSMKTKLSPEPVRLSRFSALTRLRLMILEGSLYGVNLAVNMYRRTAPRESTLILLAGAADPGVLCQVTLSPADNLIPDYLSQSDFYSALTPVYGPAGERAQFCTGTMGWTAPPIHTGFLNALFRPYFVRTTLATRRSNREAPFMTDEAREIRYLNWGMSDPGSWQAYLEWHERREAFIAALATYYRDYFFMDEVETIAMSMDAFRYISDTLIYNFSAGGVLEQFAVRSPSPQPHDLLTGTPASLIDNMIRLLVNDHPAELGNTETTFTFLRAALYTGQPQQVIEQLLDYSVNAAKAGITRASEQYRPQMQRAFENQLTKSLLAALHSPFAVKTLLALGADASSSTNSFHKTALMYAAQLDALESARLLLDAGADVQANTQANSCEPLERDARTALMYAAENASDELINLLLDAAADTTAVDSKGNDILWYLQRNTRLQQAQREELASLLTH